MRKKYNFKMYFSNILLLLLISTFTSSMRSPPRYNELQEEIQPAQEIQPAEEIQQADEVQSAEGGIPSEYDLIPFSLSYSEVIEQFIKKMTKKFHVATSGKIRMKAQSLIDSLKSNQPNDECIVESTSEPPGYQLARNGDYVCIQNCPVKNIRFISFLNHNIPKITQNLFYQFDRLYHRVKLYPVDSQTGACIDNKINKTYECVCKPKYVIKISKFFNNKILRLIKSSKQNKKINITDEHKFIAFILMLKFYPISAPLFLGFLFHKLKIPLGKSDIKDLQNEIMKIDIENQVVQEATEGVNEYKENFIKRETELFQIIMKELISTHSCNIRAIGENYFDEGDIVICYVVGIFVIGGFGLTILGHELFKH